MISPDFFMTNQSNYSVLELVLGKKYLKDYMHSILLDALYLLNRTDLVLPASVAAITSQKVEELKLLDQNLKMAKIKLDTFTKQKQLYFSLNKISAFIDNYLTEAVEIDSNPKELSHD